jgi:hypothetical protein
VALIDSATRGVLGAGWIQNARFDLPFLVGTPALALGCGALVTIDRRYFLPVLLADLWLLSYQHLAATADRGADGRGGSMRRRFLVVELPLLLLAGLAGLAFALAAWLPATLFFYWQWFRGARQSWSIIETYRRRADRAADLGDRALLTAAFYMVPAWGMLYRCAQAPDSFIGLDLRLMPVAWPMVDVVGIAACGAVGLWLVERAIAWSEGRLPLAHTLCAMSHFVVFAVAYRLIDDVVVGWLVAHVWRNAQYLPLAWLRNQRRRGGRDLKGLRLARLTRHKQLGLYAIVAIASGAAAIFGDAPLASVLPAAAFIYLAADAREYLVAWGLRRWPPRPGPPPPEREPASAGNPYQFS